MTNFIRNGSTGWAQQSSPIKKMEQTPHVSSKGNWWRGRPSHASKDHRRAGPTSREYFKLAAKCPVKARPWIEGVLEPVEALKQLDK